MHNCKSLDDSLSGTTSISVLFHGTEMTVCNVGDSRAIIGRMVGSGAAVGENAPKIPGIMGANAASATATSSTTAPQSCLQPVLRAYPLSSDQTPYRRDERERVKKYGARILSLDQIEGLEPIHENWGDVNLGEEIDEGGDPPRIWSPNGEYPGTAFTRSLGDRVAEELGVVAEPEMLTMTLSPHDRYVVIASDGVFEFLTNQSVIDMCAKFGDPLEACRAVVAESYELWLQYELRTDDITMIAIFIDEDTADEANLGDDGNGTATASANPATAKTTKDGKDDKTLAAAAAAATPSSSSGHGDATSPSPTNASSSSKAMRSSRSMSAGGEAPVELQAIMVEGMRPVRRTVSRNKRKAVMKARSAAEDEDFDMQQYISPKTDHEKARIAEAIKASFLFQHISPASRELLFSVMEKVKVRAGDWVIRQGDEGDRFYIVDNGRFEVRIKGAASAASAAATDDDDEGGKIVHVYSSGTGSHPSFGELALMYSTPRAASVIAETDGQLWALHRNIFRKVLMRRSGRKELITALRKVDVLRSLSIQQVQTLADSMTPVDYEKDECIMKQGEVGDSFFIIVSGTVSCTEKGIMGMGSRNKNTLRENDYFGERGLLKIETRAFSAVSNGKTKCLSISRSHFEATVGNLSQIIVEDKKKKEERSMALSGAGPPLNRIVRFGAIMEDDMSTTVLCKNSDDKHTLKVLWKKGVVASNAQDAVMREIDLLKTLSKVKVFSECPFIAALKSTYVDRDCLYVLYEQPVSCNLATLADSFPDGIFDEASAKHIAMCIMIALETVHSQMVVYRGISPDTISITADGSALLHDFHNARQNPDGNVTICGTPEFLAPEVVQQQGHGFPSDYWTLGVLIYYMLVGETPFEASNEIDVYAKICRHTMGSITVGGKKGSKAEKAKVGQPCLDFINKLICPDPNKRAAGRSTRVEKWFTDSEWQRMRSDKIFKIASQQLDETERLKDGSVEKGVENKYTGSNEWCEHF